MDTVTYVLGFVAHAVVRFAPVFVLSIALASLLQVLPITRSASRWLATRETTSVLAGTGLGAFSPLCSCTVVPVVRGLLVAGAPLAGVVAFWFASPLMDPEIYLMSGALLGWELATVRLVAALVMSLAAGAVTVVVVRRGWLGPDPTGSGAAAAGTDATADRGAPGSPVADVVGERPLLPLLDATGGGLATAVLPRVAPLATPTSTAPTPAGAPVTGRLRRAMRALAEVDRAQVRAVFLRESWRLGRWMLVAFALEALILRFVPQEAMVAVLGTDAPWAVPLAALLGIPLYMDNLSALPVIAGLLDQGMAPGAAIAFLLAGPVTTVPAMTAVRAVVPRPVFRLYLALAASGSIVLGLLVQLLL